MDNCVASGYQIIAVVEDVTGSVSGRYTKAVTEIIQNDRTQKQVDSNADITNTRLFASR